MKPTRRDFLKSSAAGVTISFLAPSLATRMLAAEVGGSDRVLVILQMAGGNDAVNTFIPYTDSRYRSSRPTLAIADSSILKVDDRLGFHPSMAKLAPLYEAGKFSFVNSVGFPTLDRSHFRCQDVWQTADDSYGQTQRGIRGWVGRYADLYLADADSSLTSLSIGNKIPLGMVADETISAVVQDATTFDVQTDDRYPTDRAPLLSAMRDIYAIEEGSGDVSTIRKSGSEMFSSIDLLKTISPPSSTVVYPATPLGRGMSLIAQTIGSTVGTRVVWITTGGFDTHDAQAADHTRLLTDVSDSMAAFQQDVDGRGISDRVLVMAWSEFGRRVSENANAGTDHGKAGTVFLMGDRINGRTFYGSVPDLGNLDAGDLRTEIDFRAVYATIIRDYLGHDPEPVLNGKYENLGFIRRGSPVGRKRPVRPV